MCLGVDPEYHFPRRNLNILKIVVFFISDFQKPDKTHNFSPLWKGISPLDPPLQVVTEAMAILQPKKQTMKSQ